MTAYRPGGPRGQARGKAPSAKILPHGGAFLPLPSRGPDKRRRTESIGDFRPGIDQVIRDDDGRVWVVDGEHRYAPIQVWELPVSELPPFNPKGLTLAQIRGLYNATLHTPYLSEEGRAERLASLRPHLIRCEVCP